MDKRLLIYFVILLSTFFLVREWFTPAQQPPACEPSLPAISSMTGQSLREKLPSDLQEKYYVLENEYQQLVFSSLNGAIAEINLPFSSEKNSSSVVRKIQFDAMLQKDYPANDTFPQLPFISAGTPLKNPVVGGYYPLLRRRIADKNGQLLKGVTPEVYSFSLFSNRDEREIAEYQLKRLEKNLIEFESIQNNRRVIKTFSFPPDPSKAPYCFNVAIKIDGDARALSIGTGVPEVELISGSFTPNFDYQVTRNAKSSLERVKPPKKPLFLSHVQPDWICNSNGFFGLLINPVTSISPGFLIRPISGELFPPRISVIDAKYDRFPPSKYPSYEISVPLSVTPALTEFLVYAGPMEKNIFALVDQTYANPKTGQSPNFSSSLGSHGWFSFISEPFAKFLFFLMNVFHMITNSWGISILLLTIALRIMLYPLNHWSIKSTLKMQMIAPKVAAIQERYKKDPKQAQLQVMNLYRQEGVNPFTGCLPLLVQMPFLIGMFDLLKSTFALRGASFIPGWISNLTAPDVVFSWSYPIPFFGNSFHLLPILLGVVMYLQQRFSSSTAGKTPIVSKPGIDPQKQQRTMSNIMVIVFTVMFYHFPSGLNIYWLFSMVLGILQQWWMMRRMQMKSLKIA